MRKTALITGAGRGIGRGIAIALAEKGWQVVVNYRSNSQAAEETASFIKKSGGDCLTVQADIMAPRQRLAF